MEHNIEEKPSPDANLCLHCYFLKLNDDLEKISWKETEFVPKDSEAEQNKSDGKPYSCKGVEKTKTTQQIPCQCGCNDICPECDGNRFVEYCSGGDRFFTEGCLICNNGGDPYEPTEDRIEDW
jgi:hypothetical protein